MKQIGTVIVKGTIKFIGSVDMTLYDGMTIDEAIADIIADGNYDFKADNAEMFIEGIEEVD
jgi:hypothetical protein